MARVWWYIIFDRWAVINCQDNCHIIPDYGKTYSSPVLSGQWNVAPLLSVVFTFLDLKYVYIEYYTGKVPCEADRADSIFYRFTKKFWGSLSLV